ncbi:MAG: hypothetical protein U0326_22135 [Polyangiales bacterium]
MFFELFDAFSPRDHFGPVGSAVVAFGLVPGVLALLFRSLGHRAHELARCLARYEPPREDLPLVEGHVLKGDDASPAAEVLVTEEQETRHGRSGSRAVWVERASRVTARPFSVWLPEGRALRVEPGDAPHLDRRTCTRIDAETVTTPPKRTLTLHLRPGTRVCVHGRLSALDAAPTGGDGDRDATRTLALRPPDDGPLEIHAESPVPMLRAELDRARFWRLLCPAALALAELFAFSTFIAQVTKGRTLDATVTGVTRRYERGWVGGRGGGHATRTPVTVVCAEPRDRAAARGLGEVCTRVANDDVMRFSRGASVRVLTVEGWPEANQVGEHGSVHWLVVAFTLGALMLFVTSAPQGVVAPWRVRETA